MSADPANRTQKGFSLPEVLIAAVIAAGVVAAAAQSIAASVRLSRAVERERAFLSEAQTIGARLRSGMNDAEALEGFDGWNITRETVPPIRDHEAPVFDQIKIASDLQPNDPIEFWAPTVYDEASP